MSTYPELPAYVDLEAIWAEFAPYDRFPEFHEAFAARLRGDYARKYQDGGLKDQAYARGLAAAARALRQADWIKANVGAN